MAELTADERIHAQKFANGLEGNDPEIGKVDWVYYLRKYEAALVASEAEVSRLRERERWMEKGLRRIQDHESGLEYAPDSDLGVDDCEMCLQKSTWAQEILDARASEVLGEVG